MILRTAAIEYARYSCRCSLLAIHPGTTVTQLSEPYIKNTKYKLHTPDETAKNILSVVDQQSYSPEARFYLGTIQQSNGKRRLEKGRK